MEQERIAVWRLLLLSATGGAVDLGYAIEEGYALPIIRGLGVPLKYATIALAVSPIIGLVLQPFFGALSDQCTCPWGRRKPFILCFSLMAVVGCIAPVMTYLLNVKAPIALVSTFVIMLIVLFDFSIGQLQTPARVLLLDVLPVSQSQSGNFIFSLVLIMYSTFGFCFGALGWSELFGEGFEIEHQAQVVFGFGAIAIFVSMLLTLFSVKEKRSPLITVNQSIVKYAESSADNDSSIEFINEKAPLIEIQSNNASKQMLEEAKDYTIEKRHGCCFSMKPAVKIFINCSVDVFSFIYHMSYSMWIMWFVTCFGYMGEFAFVYGFTTFFGTVIYKGDSTADIASKEYGLYSKGVRMGSLALAISTVAGGILSLSLNYITKWIKLKTVFLCILAAFVISTFLMTMLHEVYFAFIFGLSYGPLLVTLIVIPYAFLPIYEKKGKMFRNNWTDAPDVVQGKACSVINTGLFIGQIGASFLIGPVVEATGDGNYFMVVPCIAITITFFISVLIQT